MKLALTSMIRRAGLLTGLALLTACGGEDESGDDSETPQIITAPPHAPATLALTETTAPELAAQSVAVLTSLRTLGYQLAADLENVSPAHPISQTLCGGGGSWSFTYEDVDNSGTRTSGDRIAIAAPGCSIAPFGNGGAIATLLAMDDDGLADVRIAISGGTLPYLSGRNWVPTITGTLRMTADSENIWMRSEGDIVFTPDAQKSFRASNLGLRIYYDLTNDLPAPGIIGSLDIGFDTPRTWLRLPVLSSYREPEAPRFA